MDEKMSELKNWVFEVMTFPDYNRYVKAFREKKYSACVILAESYLDRAREDFFATLEKDYCDVEKAKMFHGAFKVFQISLFSLYDEIHARSTKAHA